MPQKQIRIVIVEDELLMAEVLGAWIKRHSDLELIGYANDGEKGWELCSKTKPDLALLDIELPKLDGLSLVKQILTEFPKMRVLMMSGLMDPYTIWRVLQSGVHGYINKTESLDRLMEAIRTVAEGGTFFSTVFQQIEGEWLSRPEAFQKILSNREQEILQRVAAGVDDDQISSELNISAATVETHRKHIRQKLGLHNDRGLMAYARKWGLDTRRK